MFISVLGNSGHLFLDIQMELLSVNCSIVITQYSDMPKYKINNPIDDKPTIERPAPLSRILTSAKLASIAPITKGASFFLLANLIETRLEYEKEVFLPLALTFKIVLSKFKKSFELFQ